MWGEVERTIKRHALLAPGRPTWVAVSGGLDSMVLLDLLERMGHRCSVAHVDHGLRGEASKGDRAFVEDHCKQRGLPFRVKEVDVRTLAARPGMSVQMAARELRRVWFQELVQDGPGTLALAHHADDALETWLMNIMRGVGAEGWSGIRPRQGPFIRPLIEVDREAIQAYAQHHRIAFREDASNTDPKYMRNRVRHELLPLMRSIRPGADRALRRAMESASEMQAATADLIGTTLVDLPAMDADDRSVPFTMLEQAPVPMLVLRKLLEHHRPHPERLVQMWEAVRQRRTGAVFQMGNARVFVEREGLRITSAAEAEQCWTIPSPDAWPTSLPLHVRPVTAEDVPPRSGSVVHLDAEAVPFPWTVRTWRQGDRMRPSGMTGHRMISDMLIDAKVERRDKERQLVLESAGRLVWLVGRRSAEGVTAVQGSPKAWRVELLD